MDYLDQETFLPQYSGQSIMIHIVEKAFHVDAQGGGNQPFLPCRVNVVGEREGGVCA